MRQSCRALDWGQGVPLPRDSGARGGSMSTCSVSKGCFVFKPNSKKRRISSTGDYFSEGKNDSEDSGLRFATCQLLWKQINSEMEKIQDELNKQLFDNLINFLRQSHSEFQTESTEWMCRMKSSEIPTAALVLGVNVTDHDLTFKSLSEVLQDSITPYVVSLQAKECPGIKHLLQKLMGQLMNCYVDVDDSEEEECVNISQKKMRCSMASLSQWYKDVTKALAISSNCGYLQGHGKLHNESTSGLHCYQQLLLTTQFPFKLSEKVLQVLINIFLYHDFSVQNFIKGFQLSVVEHFYSQPLSVLCCQLQEAKKRINSLSHNQCENIRSLPSFRRYVESQVSEKQIALLTEDNFLKEVTQTLLEDLNSYHENYFPVLRCLHVFTSSLPKYPLGKQIRELHCACLGKRVWETEEYGSAVQLMRMLAKAELVAILQKCVEIFTSSSGKQFSNTIEKMEEFLTRFQNLEVAETNDIQDVSVSSQNELQKKTDLYHLQKTLLELKESKRSKKLTKFEMLRFEVVDFIESLVRSYLTPAEMQTLNEVVYFNTANTLREHLNAAPRIALHTALNNPYCYLKNQTLKSDVGCISNTAPDICIAYKLHLECGRLINLVDWLEAFSTVVTAVEGKDLDSTATDQMDEIIHARFIRAVSELELLGFIKPSKQKTDHVARLTWGGC
ncbi:origin recognition complex subunit 3 isoform X4 [Pelodiscus sinensis]|uniref:origin recognition complex subunit 3 isoform X4 n=1 Tax=Pelodiscus sinensis TaxID=13735 RepID=UPI003F6CF715